MGALESGVSFKRDQSLFRTNSIRNSGNGNGNGLLLGQRNRSRFGRLLFFKKIDTLQCICGVVVFFFFIFLFQMFFLPGSVMEVGKGRKLGGESGDSFRDNGGVNSRDLPFFNEFDFGEDVKFEPMRVLDKFRKDANASVGSRKVVRYGYRKPRLALVFADLYVNPHQIMMVTVATALREIGYEIEVIALEDGPVHAIWRDTGIPLQVITADENMKLNIDWLNYNGILLNSLQAAGVLSGLTQEPFKHVPLVWTIHEQELSAQLREYVEIHRSDLVDIWKRVFSRPTVIVFPNYILPIAYSTSDPGNYFVIPGSPKEGWEADKLLSIYPDSSTVKMEYEANAFVIAIVGSELLYKGLWLEHAFILQALYPILTDFSNSSSHLNFIIVAGDSGSNYRRVVETIAVNLKYPKETVKHATMDRGADVSLSMADLVVYGSFRDEHSFPDILRKAMCLGKPIIAPDLPMIRKYVSDRVNGFLFPKEDTRVLTQIMFQMVSNGNVSPLARNAASIAKRTSKNLMVSDSVEGYASLLENILTLPSEVSLPQAAKDIPTKLKAEWQWHLFKPIADDTSNNATDGEFFDMVEMLFNHTRRDNSTALVTSNDAFLYAIWEDQEIVDNNNMKKRREDEELKDRTDQPRGTWDEVYRSARRADRSLHERDEGELERTGQPLSIYEPYYGEGTWQFLHNTSLYRGIGLSTKGRRPGADDIDAPSRLPLLINTYYRDILGEYGAFFAIANRIDRIHKNAWIGFQSWRATARMNSLSKTAERSLVDAIDTRRHGDTLYFWERLDTDPRNPWKQDFWSFCDSINAGNCQFAFSEALEKMYGIKHNVSSVPPMPADQGTWSVMQCWALPTKSFMEFVMFSRMFVDALDAQFYDDHQKKGLCYLSLSKDKHCYSRLLELLVNVWAYHSARRIVYVNPESGSMQEQHGLKNRRGKMWIKWFNVNTLKSMDEDLAEEFDADHPKRRWLWPSTGEIFWQGIFEKERNMRNKEKERKKQKSKDKIQRIRKRTHQKVIGKYVKPKVEETNSTTVAAKLLR